MPLASVSDDTLGAGPRQRMYFALLAMTAPLVCSWISLLLRARHISCNRHGDLRVESDAYPVQTD